MINITPYLFFVWFLLVPLTWKTPFFRLRSLNTLQIIKKWFDCRKRCLKLIKISSSFFSTCNTVQLTSSILSAKMTKFSSKFFHFHKRFNFFKNKIDNSYTLAIYSNRDLPFRSFCFVPSTNQKSFKTHIKRDIIWFQIRLGI